MRKKSLTVLALIAVVISVMLVFSACGGEDKLPQWKISSGVTAAFSDNGKYGYILTVDGEGEIPDYSSKKDAPWYGKSGRITEIKISDGITAVGANAFTDVKVKTVVLPRTATAVGENAFNAEAMICAYSQITAPAGVTVYIYSESQPTVSGNFWHEVNGIATAWQPVGVEPQKILFVGNSFTYYNDMPSIFGAIAASAGVSVEVQSITKGSQTLTNWVNLENEDGAKLDAALKATNDYDIVVIQEQSTRPINNYSQFLSGAQTLAEKIAATQTDCEIYLYSTWGYESQAQSKNITVPEMEARIRAAYDDVATATGATVSYAGKAFTYVYENHKDINLYNAEDNMHPSYAGSYLAACVHAATILGIDPRTVTYTGDLGESTASVLRNAAYVTVSGN